MLGDARERFTLGEPRERLTSGVCYIHEMPFWIVLYSHLHSMPRNACTNVCVCDGFKFKCVVSLS